MKKHWRAMTVGAALLGVQAVCLGAPSIALSYYYNLDLKEFQIDPVLPYASIVNIAPLQARNTTELNALGQQLTPYTMGVDLFENSSTLDVWGRVDLLGSYSGTGADQVQLGVTTVTPPRPPRHDLFVAGSFIQGVGGSVMLGVTTVTPPRPPRHDGDQALYDENGNALLFASSFLEATGNIVMDTLLFGSSDGTIGLAANSLASGRYLVAFSHQTGPNAIKIGQIQGLAGNMTAMDPGVYTKDATGLHLVGEGLFVDVVPEPTTFVLLGSGLLGLAGVARRKKKGA